jgi:hypothetical protein
MRLRIATWIGAAIVAFLAAGLVSLFGIAYLTSAFGEPTGRELVLAVLTVVWLALAAGSTFLIGRALVGELRRPQVWTLMLGATVPAFTSFLIAADTQAGTGALDVDQMGVALYLPVGLVATTIAQWATSASQAGHRAWALVTLVVALSVTVAGGIALSSSLGLAAAFAPVLAVAFGLLNAVMAMRELARSEPLVHA